MRKLLAIIAIVLLSVTALADTVGPNYCGTGANYNDGGTTAWSNPTNIEGDTTGTNASCAPPAQNNTTQKLRASNFGFNIASGSTINGIYVEIERNASNNSRFSETNIQLLIAGSESGDNKQSGVWTNSKTLVPYGSSTDKWGLNPSVSDINNSGFGVSIKGQRTSTTSVTAYVYRVRITIYYTVPSQSQTGDLQMVSSFAHDFSASASQTGDLQAVGGFGSTVALGVAQTGNLQCLVTFGHDYCLEAPESLSLLGELAHIEDRSTGGGSQSQTGDLNGIGTLASDMINSFAQIGNLDAIGTFNSDSTRTAAQVGNLSGVSSLDSGYCLTFSEQIDILATLFATITPAEGSTQSETGNLNTVMEIDSGYCMYFPEKIDAIATFAADITQATPSQSQTGDLNIIGSIGCPTCTEWPLEFGAVASLESTVAKGVAQTGNISGIGELASSYSTSGGTTQSQIGNLQAIGALSHDYCLEAPENIGMIAELFSSITTSTGQTTQSQTGDLNIIASIGCPTCWSSPLAFGGIMDLNAVINYSADKVGDISGIGALSSSMTADSTKTGDLNGIGTLASTMNAGSSHIGDINGVCTLSAIMSASASITGNVNSIGTLAATEAKTMVVVGNLSGVVMLASAESRSGGNVIPVLDEKPMRGGFVND